MQAAMAKSEALEDSLDEDESDGEGGGKGEDEGLRSHIVGIHDHTAYPPALCAIFRATKTAKNAILGLWDPPKFR